jgi:hypothetical protein
MTVVTRSLTWQASAWTTGPIRLRQGGMEHSFSGNLAQRAKFPEKETESTTLPQAKSAVIGNKWPV